jgi:hypothetical protein
MMTNRSDEYRTFRAFSKSVTFPKRSGVLRRPPEIEVAALAASQARAAPAPVLAIRGFVMKPPRVHRQPLHHLGGAPPDRRVTLQCEPLQEFLVAEDRMRGPAGFKHLAETESLLGIHQSQSPSNYSNTRSSYAASGASFVKDVATGGVGRGCPERSGLAALQPRGLQLTDQSQSLPSTAVLI